MIIEETDDKSRHFVYAAYSTEKGRVYLIIPYDSFGGLCTVSEHECTLIDNNINGYKLIVGDYGRDMIIHWSIEKNNKELAYKLIEHERGSVEELRRRLREEQPPEEMAFPE